VAKKCVDPISYGYRRAILPHTFNKSENGKSDSATVRLHYLPIVFFVSQYLTIMIRAAHKGLENT